MNAAVTQAEERFKKSVANLKEEFAGLRTGRASAAIFDHITVNYYGTKTPLNQVSKISIPEARLIVIQPFDKSLLSEIEKEIMAANLGLNPSNDGKVIRIQIPPLTGDRRKELAKQANKTAENSRVAVRNIRRDGNEELKKQLKDKAIPEDDEKEAEDELQKLTDSYIKQIDATLADKEKEIMED
jgi:ribosome recycling factor